MLRNVFKTKDLDFADAGVSIDECKNMLETKFETCWRDVLEENGLKINIG